MPSRPTSSRSARGLSESVQWAVLTPLVLMVLLGLIHAGVLMHGRGVAGQAALAGAEAQSLSGSGPGVGERVAREVAEAGGLRSVDVQAGQEGGNARVEVRAHVDSFMTAGLTRVASIAWQPVEVPR